MGSGQADCFIGCTCVGSILGGCYLGNFASVSSIHEKPVKGEVASISGIPLG